MRCCIILLVLVLVCCVQRAQSDSKCQARSGTCQYTWSGCPGSYTRYLCNGPTRRQCCVPPSSAYDDRRCTSKRGKCQWNSTPCLGGSYVANLCGGPTNRRCCIPGSGDTGFGCSGVTIVPRAAWGARKPTSISRLPMSAVPLVFIHHTAGAFCSTSASCSATVRSVQNYHMSSKRDYGDVGYNFLVGGDGKIYEGRGWDRVGAHTYGYNFRAIAISFMGNFQTQQPAAAALQAAQNLIACGVQQGKVTSNYRLYGHRQASGSRTACPGETLFNIIQGWKNWKSGTAP